MSAQSEIQVPTTVDELEQYWSSALLPIGACPGPLPDYPRQATSSAARYDTVEIPLASTLSDAVAAACQGNPALLCALVMAACDVLLQRQNGSDPVLLLTPVTLVGTEEAGTNRWLAIKTDVDPDETVQQLVERVLDRLAGAFAHQQFPFARAVELAGRTWPPNRAPLSDVAVACEGLSRMDVLRDLAVDLTVLCSLDRDGFHLRMAYRADLFAADAAIGFGNRIAHLCDVILRTPSCRVGDVSLLTAEEERSAAARIGRWEEHPLPPGRVEALIEDVARRTPEAVAIVHGEMTVTYGQLVDRARALAALLRANGVQPGDRVAVALDRGVDLVVALLGAWFGGAAFVPLEPRQPQARLQAIVKQIEPAAILAEERLGPAFEGTAPLIARQALDVRDPLPELPPSLPAAEDETRGIAYVMFTSGSTGEPNGVVVSHRALINYLSWARARYLGDTTPAFAFYSSIAFDLTLTSIFLPLVSGGSIVIVDQEHDAVAMPAIFGDPRIGVVKATPSHLKLLRASDLSGTHVRCVIVGGEPFEQELASSLQRALGGQAAIFNEYGPTEATIGCTAHQYSDEDRPGGTVPIGEPIWNAGIYLLDARRRPAAPGMPGEIYITGLPVAAGYVNSLDRTHERFVADPFHPGMKMYATGDRARYDAAGQLYFLGRGDDQVKFKGVRIDPGEVRAALVRLPRVRDAIVRIVEDEHRQQVMLACYVSRQTIDVSILRAGLMELLPLDMIPNLFVRLPRLPLTLNGKVDVERLPSLETARSHAPQEFVAPRTDTERLVAGVWREVIGVGEVSIYSNFFTLGGHSLLASQVASRMAEQLGFDVPLRLLFEAPTVAQLAAEVDDRRSSAVAASVNHA
jgi:amino acid adenylation domain-containing protein